MPEPLPGIDEVSSTPTRSLVQASAVAAAQPSSSLLPVQEFSTVDDVVNSVVQHDTAEDPSDASFSEPKATSIAATNASDIVAAQENVLHYLTIFSFTNQQEIKEILMPDLELLLPIALDIALINSVSDALEPMVDLFAAMVNFYDQPGGPSSSQVDHDAHIANVREQMYFNSPTSSDHQTALEIEIENVKCRCSAIKELVKRVSHEQSAAKYGFEFFKDLLTKDVLDISENISRMFVEISTFKSHFIKTQSDVILAQTIFSSSAQVYSDSLKSRNSMVEVLDAKVNNQSASLQYMNSHVGNIS